MNESFKEIEEIKKILLKHCYDASILRLNAEDKKREAILGSLVLAVIKASLTIVELKDCIEDINEGRVLDLKFFKNGGNLFRDYINQKWVHFARSLWAQRSHGLGTPNAASGEGELMFLFLSKDIKKPTKGDLQIGNEIIELKGEGARVFGETSGVEFRKRTLEVCKKFSLTPNQADIKIANRAAVEIEKSQHLPHWLKELSKLSLEKQKEFINSWLGCLDNKDHSDSVNIIFAGKSFEHKTFVKEIVKILYSITVNNSNFDKFMILGNGENVKIIGKDIKDFNRKIDNGEIKLQSDYFRINQKLNIGWYIT